ncbi:MAG: lactonase family protein [Bryobacteraceae bacterium]
MKRIRHLVQPVAPLLAALLFASALPAAQKAKARDYFVYIGTYTREDSKGIYAYRFNLDSGQLTPIGLAAEVVNPSFLAVDPKGRHIYAVSEVADFQGQKSGAVSAFEIDPGTGKLKLLNTVPTGGGGACHLVVDKASKNVLVANYGGGSIASLPLKSDGSLEKASAFVQHEGSSVDPKRQRGPHAHSINLSQDNRHAVVADLGLDQVLVYDFSPKKGTLTANDPPFAKVKPGAGPRHFAFHPKGRYAYVINELQSTVTAFSYDPKRGVLTELQTITTLPEDFSGENYTAEVQVHPSGKFVYGSNRGHDSIAVFAVDAGKGTLTPVEQVSTKGKTPRNFGIDPTGSFLIAANQNTDNLVVFRIDPATGRLTPTGQEVKVDAPVCVKFVAAK